MYPKLWILYQKVCWLDSLTPQCETEFLNELITEEEKTNNEIKQYEIWMD